MLVIASLAAPGDTGPTQGGFRTLLQGAISGIDAAVAALVVRLGEAGLAAFEEQAVDAVVAQADAAKGLRQHARFAAGDDRVAEEQVTGLELGVERRLELERGTGSGEGVRRSAQLAVGLGVFGRMLGVPA